MTLPTGKWTLNADGVLGTLAIGALAAADATGNRFFTGTATFGAAYSISGYWEETHQEIYFLLPAQPNYARFQVYRGNLFSSTHIAGLHEVTTWTMAGDLRIFSMTANTAAWNALLVPPMPPTPWPNLWCAQIELRGIADIKLKDPLRTTPTIS